jgi:hypothetical protein
MVIQLIRDKEKLEGTAYFELLPGRYKKKSWNEESVFLDEESFGFVEHIIEEWVEKYNHYSFVEVNEQRWEGIVVQLLSMRNRLHQARTIDELDGNVGFFFADTRERFAQQFDKNRQDLETMLYDLVKWIRQTLKEHERISILGL